jgi:hypothetical protein
MERILRTEKVKSGMFGRIGWLTLTDSRLIFSKSENIETGADWSVPLERVETVRATKAFRAGTELLEVYFRDEGDNRAHKTFERFSVAAWASAATTFGLHRAEPNSFQGFEAQVISAREARVAAPAAGSGHRDDITVRLERLAELHKIGSLSDAEFAAAKSKLLSDS